MGTGWKPRLSRVDRGIREQARREPEEKSRGGKRVEKEENRRNSGKYHLHNHTTDTIISIVFFINN